jgi:prevent-host-death family protein
MQTINVRETREKLSSLLDAVLAGEEIVIVRNGKPAARLTAPLPDTVQFPDRSELRAALPPSAQSSGDTVRILRDEERF